MRKKILAFLFKLILAGVVFISMSFYIYFLIEIKNLFLALYFIAIFCIMYFLVIKIVVTSSEKSTNKKTYKEIYFKIDTSTTIKNKKFIMNNIEFLKKMQFLHFYFLINPKVKQDFPQTYEGDSNLLKKFIKNDNYNNLMEELDNLSVEKRYKKLKKEKKDLTKNDFYQIVHEYDFELYEEKMMQLLNEKSFSNEKNFGVVFEILILIATYCFPLIMYTKNNNEKITLIASMAVLGILLIFLIIIFKPLYLRKLEEENNDFIKKLDYFKQYYKN